MNEMDRTLAVSRISSCLSAGMSPQDAINDYLTSQPLDTVSRLTSSDLANLMRDARLAVTPHVKHQEQQNQQDPPVHAHNQGPLPQFSSVPNHTVPVSKYNSLPPQDPSPVYKQEQFHENVEQLQSQQSQQQNYPVSRPTLSVIMNIVTDTLLVREAKFVNRNKLQKQERKNGPFLVDAHEVWSRIEPQYGISLETVQQVISEQNLETQVLYYLKLDFELDEIVQILYNRSLGTSRNVDFESFRNHIYSLVQKSPGYDAYFSHRIVRQFLKQQLMNGEQQ